MAFNQQKQEKKEERDAKTERLAVRMWGYVAEAFAP